MECKVKKTRDLTIYEYFEVLQLEYIVAELRKKIYPSLNDQGYYTRVMGQKKEKIDDIAERNNLPSIFNDKKIKKIQYNKIYSSFGLPNFLYTDKEHENKYAVLDRKFYYFPGSEVKIIIEGEMKVGNIDSVDFNEDKAVIIVKKQTYELPLTHISRIL